MKTNLNSPLVLSIVSTEGGAGKSTTAINVAWQGYIRKGWRVLLVDLDSNKSLNHFLGTKAVRSPNETSLCLFESGFSGALPIIPVFDSASNIYLLPGHETLQADLITTRMSREKILKKVLPQTQAYSEFDLIILDNRGGIDAITHNSIAAATHLLIGSKVGVKSPDLASAINSIAQVVRDLDLNPEPDLLGVFFSEMNTKSKTHQLISEGARKGLSKYEGLKIYPDIPSSVLLAQANARHLPLSKVRASSSINEVYQAIIEDLAA